MAYTLFNVITYDCDTAEVKLKMEMSLLCEIFLVKYNLELNKINKKIIYKFMYKTKATTCQHQIIIACIQKSKPLLL